MSRIFFGVDLIFAFFVLLFCIVLFSLGGGEALCTFYIPPDLVEYVDLRTRVYQELLYKELMAEILQQLRGISKKSPADKSNNRKRCG